LWSAVDEAIVARWSGRAFYAFAGPAFLLHDHQPVHARFFVGVDPLAIVTAHALRLDDLRALNGAPLAGALADLARLAFGPSLDWQQGGDLRNDAEHGADRTEKPAIEVAHHQRREEEHREHRPQQRIGRPGEHPERLDVAVDAGLLGRDVVADDRDEQSVLDEAGAAFQPE